MTLLTSIRPPLALRGIRVIAPVPLPIFVSEPTRAPLSAVPTVPTVLHRHWLIELIPRWCPAPPSIPCIDPADPPANAGPADTASAVPAMRMVLRMRFLLFVGGRGPPVPLPLMKTTVGRDFIPSLLSEVIYAGILDRRGTARRRSRGRPCPPPDVLPAPAVGTNRSARAAQPRAARRSSCPAREGSRCRGKRRPCPRRGRRSPNAC